jgi:hypothetical protein
VLRTIRGETKAQRRDHLTVFREFLNQLDRATRKPRAPKGKARIVRRRGK